MAIRILGTNYYIGKKKVALSNNSNNNRNRKHASEIIVKQYRREVSFQIADIRTAMSLVDNPKNPDRKKLLEIFRYIMRDGHLSSQIKVAKLKVLAEPWILYKNNQPDEAATKLFKKRWFNKIIEYALEAEFYGHSLVEVDGIDTQNTNIAEVELIDRFHVSPEKQLILIDGTINGSFVEYGDIKEDIDLLEFGDRNTLGCLLECSYNVIWKYYSRSDWSRTSEKFGMPIIAYEADTNDDKELDAIENRSANFGTDGYIVMQKGDKANVLERKGDNGHLIFKDNILLCNEEVSKIINGQTATSDQKAYVGAAEVQENTMDDFTEARLQNIVDEITENVMPYLIYKGFNLEGYEFDYPALKRKRDAKINGIQKQEPTETKTKQLTEQE